MDMYVLSDGIDRIEPINNIITWCLGNQPSNGMDKDTVYSEIKKVIDEIQSHIFPIRFKHIECFSEADIRMAFSPPKQDFTFTDPAGNPVTIGTPFEFDGKLGILAMGFYPVKGELKGLLLLDDQEDWATQNDWDLSQIDLQTVVLHEILHVFGLKHTTNKKTIMYAEYSGEKRQMHQDDIDGIRDIYKDIVIGYHSPKKSWIRMLLDYLIRLFQ